MKKYFLPLIIFFLFVNGCDFGEKSSEKPQVFKKEKLTGFVQKGPFVSGTSILMNELNSKLEQTGKIFTSTISNDLGLFELSNITLNSNFVEFVSSGFYFNEVSGEISISPITLTTLSDISDKTSININVLTHLEKKRVEALMKEGKSFGDAKKQSRTELLSVFAMNLSGDASFEQFDISKNNEEGAILLAISIVLQGKRTVGQLTELLSNIQNDFANNGKIDDEKILYALRVTSSETDLDEVRKNLENRYKQLNITSTIPSFENQINKFLNPKMLNISIEGEGTVEEKVLTNPSGKEYPNNTVVELTPKAKEGWVFDSWGGDLSGNEIPKRVTVDGDKNVIAKFKRRDYPLNLTIEGEGTVEERIVFNPNAKLYPFETVVELIPIPKEGWSFDGWNGDITSRDNPLKVVLNKEISLSAKFSQPIFKILENGVTCVCEGVNPGQKGSINGVEYEAVDNALLRKRRDEGSDLTKLCTSLVTDMKELFGSKNFNQAIGNWDVSNVTTMEFMFFGSSFNQQIEHWDVGKVTNMKNMFQESKFNQPIGKWDVSNVTDMYSMFRESPFNQPIGNWKVGNVKNMAEMFFITPFNQAIANWDVSNVVDMRSMFGDSPFNQFIGGWNVSNVRDMHAMFANNLFNQPIGNWNVSNVEVMRYMFARSPFNQPIGNWNVGKVKDMQGMFWETFFNQQLEDWNVSNVENMHHMFLGNKAFNQSIHKWNVSKVTTMYGMFGGSVFNQPIGNWNVGNVKDMSYMFNFSAFNQTISNWNVSKVTDMSYMFWQTPFNQTINEWKVTNVKNMRAMFRDSKFNQPIDKWDVSNVENMTWMFNNSPFNQNISKWCVSKITSEPLNFSNGSPLVITNKPAWGTCPD